MAQYTVLGGSGFIGSRIVAALSADGTDVFVPRRNDPKLFEENLGQVFYFAGLTADYARRPFDTVEAHVTLVARLLRQARFDRLIYTSSTRLYDSLGTMGGGEENPLRLNPNDPRHLYDLSKALGENLCLTQSEGRGAVLRLSCVYDWRPGGQGFLSEWLQSARHTKTLHIDSQTGYVRDYVNVDDVVSSARAIMNSGGTGIFNVASGENTSNAELADIFRKHGWEIALGAWSPRQVAPTCDVTRLKDMGVQPRPTSQVLGEILSYCDFYEAR